jgi:hypothetical protein
MAGRAEHVDNRASGPNGSGACARAVSCGTIASAIETDDTAA